MRLHLVVKNIAGKTFIIFIHPNLLKQVIRGSCSLESRP